MNEGSLKKNLVYFIVVFRWLTLVLIFLLWHKGNLTDTPFYELLRCVLPLTVLYNLFVIKYIVIRKRYFNPGAEIKFSYFIASCLPLIIFHLTELVLILFNLSLFDPNFEPLYWYIIALECLLGAYAGFYLANIFSNSISN